MPTLGIAVLALLTPLAFAQNNNENAPGQQKKIPEIPVGWLDAYPTIVQTGTHPTIRWGVNLPSEVLDVIEIKDGSTIVASDDICVDCRMLGNGVTVHFQDGSWQFVEAEAQISFDGSAYESVFFGTNRDVDPDAIIWQRTGLKKGQTIRFGGRYKWNNQWGPTYTSNNSSQNVRTLVDGDAPPDVVAAADVPSLEDFIKPYLDSNGRVNIGPMDVIVFMELTHSDSQMTDPGYDMQDLVMICTMKPKAKRNNRSGLADGTNPGQGNQMGNNDGTDNPNEAPHSGGSN